MNMFALYVSRKMRNSAEIEVRAQLNDNSAATPEFIVEISGKDDAGTLDFAAEEFLKYCGMIFAGGFEKNTISNTSAACSISSPTDTAAEYADDEYEIAAGGGTLVLRGGTPRAVLFAVYDFLETHLDCRWYYPDPEDQIVPQHDLAKFSDILGREFRYRKSPEFSFREREYQGKGDRVKNVINEVDWWAKLRMNIFLFNWGVVTDADNWRFLKEKIFPEIRKRGLETGLAEHGAYNLFMPHEKYFTEHSEWFCMQNGKRVNAQNTQFCTKNPEAVWEFLNNLRAFAKNNPELTIYYPAPNDIGGWCECDLCKNHTIADRYMEIGNKIAAVLAEVNKRIKVLHLIYGTHKALPESVNSTPAPNVILDLALWGRDYSCNLDDEQSPDPLRLRKLLEIWTAYSKRVSGKMIKHCKLMRQTWLGMRLLPLPSVERDMKYLKQQGFHGFDFPLASVGIWTKSLPVYIIARKRWDLDADSPQMIREYFELYYGGEFSFAENAARKQMEAFPNNRYAGYRMSQGNFSISWSVNFWKPEKLMDGKPDHVDLLKLWMPDKPPVSKEELVGIMKNATAASVKILQTAFNEAETGLNKSEAGIYKARFRKLCTALRQTILEQKFLNVSAVLTETITKFTEIGGGNSALTRENITEIYSELKRILAELANNGSAENDEHGLLWFGDISRRLENACEGWENIMTQKTREI